MEKFSETFNGCTFFKNCTVLRPSTLILTNFTATKSLIVHLGLRFDQLLQKTRKPNYLTLHVFIGVGSGGSGGHWPPCLSKCIDFATKFRAIFDFSGSLSKCFYIF